MVKAKSKLLLFTDCDFFAGCEKPLENIVSYPKITEKYNIVYAYRKSKEYTSDLEGKELNARLMPLLLLTPDSMLKRINKKRKLLFLLAKICVRIPEKLQIFNLINLIIQLIVLLKENPEIVHINNGGFPGADSCRIMAISSGLLRVKKIIFTVNNMAVPRNHILDKFLDLLVNKYVTHFVTASKAAGKQLIKVREIGEGKIHSIPNAVLFDDIRGEDDISLRKEFSIDTDTFIMGSAGLLIERKGYDVLIEALKEVPKDRKWCLYIFGDGDQRDFLQSLIKKYSLQEHVFLPGFRNNIHSFISGFDIFILSSTGTEDMPNAINEAMLIGKPIIGTKTSGIPEQIDDGVNGFLVDQGDPQDLASKINILLSLGSADLSKMGLRSKEKYMSSFSYDIAMDKYLNLYNS